MKPTCKLPILSFFNLKLIIVKDILHLYLKLQRQRVVTNNWYLVLQCVLYKKLPSLNTEHSIGEQGQTSTQ